MASFLEESSVKLRDMLTDLDSKALDGLSITSFLKEFTEDDLLLPFTVEALLDTEEALFLTTLLLLVNELCLLLFLEFNGDDAVDDVDEDDDIVKWDKAPADLAIL